MMNESLEVYPQFLRHEEIQSNRDETKFHPSEATNCSLAVWFLKRHARGLTLLKPAPQHANLLMIFRIGHLVHHWVQGHYVRTGICEPNGIEYQILDEKRGITGSIDLLTKEKVIDLKTCSWKVFSGKIPKHEHIVQTSIYAHYTGRDWIEVHYIAKDSGKLWNWVEGVDTEAMGMLPVSSEQVPIRVAGFHPREDLVYKAFEKFAQIETAIQADSPPDPEFSPMEPASPCSLCQWRYHCRDLMGRHHPSLGATPVELNG